MVGLVAMLAEAPIKFCGGHEELAIVCFGSFFLGEHMILGAVLVGYGTN
jgi:hypothetical protein